MDEYFAAFCILDGKAGLGEAEVMSLQRILQCAEMCK